MTKLKVYPPEEIIDIVRKIHHNDEDFTEGDISDRISSYNYYILKRIPTNEIYSPWALNEELSTKYSMLKTSMPPIVLDSEKTVIDGTHRVDAAIKRGDKYIMAYVGQEG